MDMRDIGGTRLGQAGADENARAQEGQRHDEQ
jgi:hypothetical protein